MEGETTTTQETIDKIKYLSETKERLSKFLKNKSINIGKGHYSALFLEMRYTSVEDEIFTKRVNELAKQRLEEIEKELEEL